MTVYFMPEFRKPDQIPLRSGLQRNMMAGGVRGTKPAGNLSKIHFGFLAGPDEFQRRPVSSLERQIQNFGFWADNKQAILQAKEKEGGWRYAIPAVDRASQPDGIRQRENAATMELFRKTFPNFLWTGIECSNPITPQGERWDELELCNFYSAEERKKQIGLMRSLGFTNVRLGMPNHRIVSEYSWSPMDGIFKSFYEDNQDRPESEKIKISLDLQHFGLPDYFRLDSDKSKSFYLNPAWPNDFVHFATAAVKRYKKFISAITIINEPMITNKFSNGHLNEAFPGNSHPLANHYFIERALLIGKAAVNARLKIEEQFQANPKPTRRIFIHNESCENQVGDESFNKYAKFLGSDLILGHSWLLRGDYQQSDTFKWLENNYVRPDHPEDRQNLVTGLEEIRQAHFAFQQRFNKTMRADTVFGIDFYLGCERGPGITGRIEDYAAEVASGVRKGLFGLTKEAWDRYHLPILHTETNMENKNSEKWANQQLLELAQVAKSGIPVLGFTWYSLMDQYGWDRGLDYSPWEARRNHIGLVSMRDYDLREVAKNVLPELRNWLENGRQNVSPLPALPDTTPNPEQPQKQLVNALA